MTTSLSLVTCLRSRYPICQIAVALGCLCLAATVSARSPSSGAVDAETVQPFVSETTFLIVKVDPKELGLPNLDEQLETISPEAQAAARQVSAIAGAGIAQLRALTEGHPVYATLGIPISEDRGSVFAFTRGLSSANTAKLTEFLQQPPFKSQTTTRGDYLIAAPVPGPDPAELLAEFPAAPRDGIRAAFQSVETYPIQVLLLPPAYVRRTIEELSPTLPDQLGGGPSRVLTKGVQWAALGFNPERLQARLIIQSSTQDAAKDLAVHLPKMLQAAYDAAFQENDKIPADVLQTLIHGFDFQVDGDRVVLQMDGLAKTQANLHLFGAILRTVEDKTRRNKNADGFKRILLAMHNYHDVFKSFPPADDHRNRDVSHGLSWRVHILPFIGQAELYEEFHLGESWDSDHNKQLLEKMPDAYASQSFDIPPRAVVKPGYTTFQAPVGEDTVFGSAEASKIRDILDGTSNTVVLVEVKPEKAVPWTAPDDYRFDPEDPAAGLQIGADGRWLCAYADGSVHQLRGDISPETILWLFQMNDGHPIDQRAIR